ncbi:MULTISPECIES: IS5/IS1182 family transposase [Acidiphilium]|uniref:Transposase DDE domain-containing protein n=1 Tax=Acidiphilium rubrum TaxID=526 RepID=A0A8G2FHR1_ACIRU|nr:Transposase DDE domain-containing protein [Acidiphilium rubrum]
MLQTNLTITTLPADGGYQLPKLAAELAKIDCMTLRIVKRSEGKVGFSVLPKRWIVKRTFAWISNCRLLAMDYERHTSSAVAFVRHAIIKIMLRRIARLKN